MNKQTILLFLVTLTLLTSCAAPQKKVSGELPLPPTPTSPGDLGQESLAIGKAVPWAPWAADMTGVTLSPLDASGAFVKPGDLTLAKQGDTAYFGKIYHTDVTYILSTLKAGGTLDATKVWVQRDFTTPAGAQRSLRGGFFETTPTTGVDTKLPTTNFEVNTQQYNAIAIYSCTCKNVKAGTATYLCTDPAVQTLSLYDYVAYDCHGAAETRLNPAGQLLSGTDQGKWQLITFPVAAATIPLPPAPGAPGTVAPPTTTTPTATVSLKDAAGNFLTVNSVSTSPSTTTQSTQTCSLTTTTSGATSTCVMPELTKGQWWPVAISTKGTYTFTAQTSDPGWVIDKLEYTEHNGGTTTALRGVAPLQACGTQTCTASVELAPGWEISVTGTVRKV